MPKADPRTPNRRERFRSLCKAKGWLNDDTSRWNVQAISAATGKSPQKISDLLNGHGSFGAKIAREIEDALDLGEGHLDGMTAEEDFATVPQVMVKLSAGRGMVVFEERFGSSLSFRRSFLKDIGVSANNAVVVSVQGHSMEPTIKDGSVLLISKANKTIFDRQIYALRINGDLYVKRILKAANGTLLAVSDNQDRKEFPDIDLTNSEEVEVIGRALWMGSRL